MNAQIETAETPISIESIRADYRKKLADLFAKEAKGITGIDWHISHAVVNKRPYFDIGLKTNSEALEEWMRPAFADMLAETRSRLDDLSIHHMNVEGFQSWHPGIYDGSSKRLYWPASVRLRFHFNAESEVAEQPAIAQPKQSWLDALLGRPKPVACVPEKKFIMTLE